MNLSTVKWAQWDKTQSRELLDLFICVCIALCTIVSHNIAQNRPDSFPPYPPDNRHCSDDVYLREGGGGVFLGYWSPPVSTHPPSKCTITKLDMLSHVCILVLFVTTCIWSRKVQFCYDNNSWVDSMTHARRESAGIVYDCTVETRCRVNCQDVISFSFTEKMSPTGFTASRQDYRDNDGKIGVYS